MPCLGRAEAAFSLLMTSEIALGSRAGDQRGSRRAARGLLRRLPQLEVSPPVLLPALLGGLSALGAIFAVRDGGQAVRRQAQVDEETFHRCSAAVSQAQVVLFAAALVAVALNRNTEVGVGLQSICVGGQSLLGVGADVGLVEIKIGV